MPETVFYLWPSFPQPVHVRFLWRPFLSPDSTWTPARTGSQRPFSCRTKSRTTEKWPEFQLQSRPPALEPPFEPVNVAASYLVCIGDGGRQLHVGQSHLALRGRSSHSWINLAWRREGLGWVLNQRILVYLVQTHMVTVCGEVHLNTMRVIQPSLSHWWRGRSLYRLLVGGLSGCRVFCLFLCLWLPSLPHSGVAWSRLSSTLFIVYLPNEGGGALRQVIDSTPPLQEWTRTLALWLRGTLKEEEGCGSIVTTRLSHNYLKWSQPHDSAASSLVGMKRKQFRSKFGHIYQDWSVCCCTDPGQREVASRLVKKRRGRRRRKDEEESESNIETVFVSLRSSLQSDERSQWREDQHTGPSVTHLHTAWLTQFDFIYF